MKNTSSDLEASSAATNVQRMVEEVRRSSRMTRPPKLDPPLFSRETNAPNLYENNISAKATSSEGDTTNSDTLVNAFVEAFEVAKPYLKAGLTHEEKATLSSFFSRPLIQTPPRASPEVQNEKQSAVDSIDLNKWKAPIIFAVIAAIVFRIMFQQQNTWCPYRGTPAPREKVDSLTDKLLSVFKRHH